MARSPPSEAPGFSESFRHALPPEFSRDYPPTPDLHRSRPVSPYFQPAQFSRSASPPIIMGGIRGPSATANSPEQYLTTEDVMRFITPISRPLSSLSRRSLSSPVPERIQSRPPSVVYSDRFSPRPSSIIIRNARSSSVAFSDHASSRAPSVVYIHDERSRRRSPCSTGRSTRPPSPVNIRDFIGRTPPSVCGGPLVPDDLIQSIGRAPSPEYGSVASARSLSPRVRSLSPVRTSSRSPSVGYVRYSSSRGPTPPIASQPVSFYNPRSAVNSEVFVVPVSRLSSRAPSRSSPCVREFRMRAPSPLEYVPSRSVSREPSVYEERHIIVPQPASSRASSVYEERHIIIDATPMSSRAPSVISEHRRSPIIIRSPRSPSSVSSRRSECQPSPVPSRSPRSASPASSTSEHYAPRIITIPSRSPSRRGPSPCSRSPRAPFVIAPDTQEVPSLATARNNLVKTTLEQLRNVSQGVMSSLRDGMEILKDEMALSIQQKFEEMKQESLKGAQLSLDHVRTEMDIVKVEARELLDVKEKLRNDVSELVQEMRTLRWDIDLAKEDLKRIASQVHQEKEDMEVQMREMISQLQKERALRDSEREAEEKAKEERAPTCESYNPRYIPVPMESEPDEVIGENEETEEEDRSAQRPGSMYNPAYVSLPPNQESADEKAQEEKIQTRESSNDPVPVLRPPPITIRPLTRAQFAERRMTWDGHFPAGPVAPCPPPPPPPPPPPRPSDAPATNANANERRFSRHLPRPPTQEEPNGNATLSGSDLDGNGANVTSNGFRSPFVPTNLSRANTVGGGRFSEFRRWGRGDEAYEWGHFGVPNRHRYHQMRSDENERGNTSFSRPHNDDEESHGIDGVRRGFAPHGHLPVPPPAPFPAHPVHHGHFGLRRMHSVPSRLHGSARFAHNHWRHSFNPVGTISENDILPQVAFDATPAPPAPAPVSAPGVSSTGGDLSSKSSTERMSSGSTRIERVEVEEARRVYKAKKAAWKRQRDEARKAFMTQTQGQPDSTTTQPQPGRVRPFDAITIPAELPNGNGNGAASTMPGALPDLSARQGGPQSRTTLPPPLPPPLPRFQQQQQPQRSDGPFTNIRFSYPAMPGSLPVPSLQGTPQPQLHQQQPPQQGPEPRPANVRWSVRFAPPPGPGYPPPEHVRPRSVPSPFPQPVNAAAESTDEEPRRTLRPVNVDVESSDEEVRENLPASLPPLVQPAQLFPFGFHVQTERQLKNYILNKLSTMGFKSLSGGSFDSIVEKEVRDEAARVKGHLQSADVVSMVERLVERLLANPNFLNGTNANSNSRSISPSPRLIGALAAAHANTSASGVGTRSSGVPASNTGSIPGQWNGRDL